MKATITSMLFLALLIFSCQKNIEQPKVNYPEKAGQLSMKIDMTNAPSEVMAIRGMLIQNKDTIRFEFKIKDNYAQARVDNIPTGTWFLRVDALNAQGAVIFTGSTRVVIMAGQTTPVYLQLNKTGSIEIIVTWDEHTPKILAYFPFDSTYEDFSLFHNNALKFGDVHFAPGIHGQAVGFDGMDDFLQINNLEVYNTEEKSIAFWFYKDNNSIRDTPNLDDVEGLIFKSFDTSLRRDFSFSIGLQNPPFNVAFVTYQNTDSLTFLKMYEAIQPRTWYHLVGTISKHKVCFYINGELVSEASVTHPIYHSDAPIIIGAVPPPDRYFSRFFVGKIDEFAIFSQALDAEQVKEIYQYGIKE